MDFSKEEPNLPSDSDDSDDDYVPSGAESNPPSEVESDGVDEDAPDSEEESQSSKKRRKTQKVSKKKARKKGRNVVEVTEDQNASENDDDRTKEKPLTEEEEKKRADSLWADFMNDTKTSCSNTKAENNEKLEKIEKVDETISKVTVEKTQPKKEEKENKVTVTEVFEFAGEEVKVTKEVDASSQEAHFVSKTVGSGSSGPPSSRGRGRASGGLSSVLGQLGKKSKLGTLEKSKLDWDRFKKTEGIDEELKTFNRGKDGYLEKQDFLQRTDLRQFEIEKGLRATRRSNR